jgi:hypothetical protein
LTKCKFSKFCIREYSIFTSEIKCKRGGNFEEEIT